MYKRSIFIGLLLIGLCGQGLAAADEEITAEAIKKASALSPSKQQVRATSIILGDLRRHYQKRPFNDQLSQDMFDSYIKSLDPGKNYFLSSDIEEFEQWRSQLDDTLRIGNLKPGFLIFNRFQQRMLARLQWAIEELEYRFDKLERHKDEHLVLDREELPWAGSMKELDQLWQKRLLNLSINLLLSDKEKDKKEVRDILIKRYKNQLKRAVQTNGEDAFQVYINALTQSYDPHTQYLSPRRSENFNINMKLSLQGIGAELSTEDGYTKVVRLIPGGPAKKAGELSASDKIIGVAQGKKEMIDVVGWRLDEVVQKIRGPKGSIVRLEIIPNDSINGKSKVIQITRDTVKLEEQAAKHEIIELPHDGESFKVGVISLHSFYLDFEAYHKGKKDYRSATRDVENILEKMKEAKVDAVVVDLRNNGGGSLSEANSMVGLFIPYGPTVQVKNASGEISQMRDHDPMVAYRGPLAVLINRHSASASEIFAGAIQDYNRGIIIGERSFGKGTVQHLKPLNQGQLKITQAKFYRVSGKSNQHEGIVPDIEFPSSIDHDEEGESALPNALTSDTIQRAYHLDLDKLPTSFDNLTSLTMERRKADAEFQFIREQIDLIEERRNKKVVSLDIKKRRQEQKQADKQLLEITNARNKAIGRETYKSAEKMHKAEEDYRKKLEEEHRSLSEDPFVIEASRILNDMARPNLTSTAKVHK